MERLWKRTWVLYLATIGVSLGFAIVALRTDWLLWAGFEAGDFGGPVDLLAGVLTLRIAIGGVDILVAYVFYLLAAIAALRLMEQGRSWLVATTVAGLYVASQLAEPGAFGLGFASFRVLVPNAPLFFGGLLLGYHRDAVAAGVAAGAVPSSGRCRDRGRGGDARGPARPRVAGGGVAR